jgi:hypothetical protein
MYDFGFGKLAVLAVIGLAAIPFFLWEIGRFVWWLVSHLHWS